jgi:hypothetical protein
MKTRLLKNIKIPAILILLGLFFIFPTISVLAQQDYVLLAELPNLKSVPQENALGKYIPYIFNMAVGLSAVAAVVMIVFGGFQYITTDALQGKQQGRERILNAVKGLVLVITAYLILYTINPGLLEIDLTIDQATVSGPSSTTGGGGGAVVGVPMTTEQIAASNTVKKLLEDKDVWPYRGPCEQGQITNCVNLNGLLESTQNGLINLNKLCDEAKSGGCNIHITGGTEGGHSTTGDHPKGAAVDMKNTDSNLREYIIQNKKDGDPVMTSIGPRYELNISGQTVYFTDEGASAPGSTGAHWHVVFK